jgi:hypothetical protein
MRRAAGYVDKILRGVASYDRDHETMSLRYMDGKIASVLPLAVVASRIRESAHIV